MCQYWGKKATIKGIVHFRPSGKPRLVEAQVIKIMDEGEEFFDNIPQVQTEAAFLKTTKEAAVQTGWLKEIWGKLSCDEPIETLLAALRKAHYDLEWLPICSTPVFFLLIAGPEARSVSQLV